MLVRYENDMENEIKVVKNLQGINMNLVLKFVQIFDFSVPCSTIVYQLMFLCSSEITLDVFRH